MDWKFAEETTAWVADSASGEDLAWIITINKDGQFTAEMSSPPLNGMAAGPCSTFAAMKDRCELAEDFVYRAMDFMLKLEKLNDHC